MGAPIFSSLGSLVTYIPLWHTFQKRAAVVYNFMRGLSVQSQTEKEAKASNVNLKSGQRPGLNKSASNVNLKSGQRPGLNKSAVKDNFRSKQRPGLKESPKDRNKDIFEKVPTSPKKLYAVDAGLAFNSPYPLLLRPQRGVDLVLSFEYSSRDQDETSLFSELLLAKEWAKLNKFPFPDIDPDITDREGLKECYVFENPDDPKCPIVMHFVILNAEFREYKAPGVPRRTKEEKDYGNFDIFDDPNGSYSTSNFKYTNQAFDRLADLMEFNTLLWKEEIIENIKKCVKKRAN
ncbi:cytosolic phospholipase A2-like isoform X2 [Mercenaria mercenaria]|uniref:cytosolic phospholipase A2-like isoform X2 n=1 Tax=Mercenaria mercenaria TaxID=6596 RepID=UPI00234F216A|nr:cytosolic phospholipase A2-like isoform X2 [Mercenaria mercenaria]